MHIKILLKETIRKALKYHPLYLRQRKREENPSPSLVEEAVRAAVRDVPFYAGYTRFLDGPFDLKRFPIIRKTDILDGTNSMVSRRAFRPTLQRKETGGSTGVSLTLLYSPSTIVLKEVSTDRAFSLIGKNLRIAVLRGQVPEKGQICQPVGNGDIIMSAYKLSSDTLDSYLQALRRHRISCLHVYPSAISILARLIIARYGSAPDLPQLKGILASSEIFSHDDKVLVRQAFPGVKIVDLYGHNELACMAVSVDGGPFEFNEAFGHVEFIPTGHTVNGNREAEIVATSIMNSTMPFIRYATDDYVELDPEGKPVAIVGRTSDHVINKSGELMPCIVLTRDESFAHITNFQYLQTEPGRLTMRVVPTAEFTDYDRRLIREDMDRSFNGKMDCDVVTVDSIERTTRGKQLRLILSDSVKQLIKNS